MDMHSSKYLIALFASLALTFSSCNQDESYDVVGNPNNLVYFTPNRPNTFECKIVHTPAGDVGTVKVTFPEVSMQRTSDSPVEVKPEVDTSLVKTYNAQHGTSYKAVPSEIVKFAEPTVTIPTGETKSEDKVTVEIAPSDFNKLSEPEYLVPVKLTVSLGKAMGSIDRGIGYIIIKTANLPIVNTNPTSLVGSRQGDFNNWNCISASGLDKEGFKGVLSASIYGGGIWRMSQPSATFVVDLQEEKNITAIGLTSYKLETLSLSLSTDNKTWKDLGTFTNQQLLYQNYAYNAVFNAAVPSRYLKVTVNIIESAPSRYREIRSFNIYAE